MLPTPLLKPPPHASRTQNEAVPSCGSGLGYGKGTRPSPGLEHILSPWLQRERLPYGAPHRCRTTAASRTTAAAPRGQGTRRRRSLPGLWRDGACDTGKRTIILNGYEAQQWEGQRGRGTGDVSGKQGTRDPGRKGHSRAGKQGGRGQQMAGDQDREWFNWTFSRPI